MAWQGRCDPRARSDPHQANSQGAAAARSNGSSDGVDVIAPLWLLVIWLTTPFRHRSR
jgi:hypothetical protein